MVNRDLVQVRQVVLIYTVSGLHEVTKTLREVTEAARLHAESALPPMEATSGLSTSLAALQSQMEKLTTLVHTQVNTMNT